MLCWVNLNKVVNVQWSCENWHWNSLPKNTTLEFSQVVSHQRTVTCMSIEWWLTMITAWSSNLPPCMRASLSLSLCSLRLSLMSHSRSQSSCRVCKVSTELCPSIFYCTICSCHLFISTIPWTLTDVHTYSVYLSSKYSLLFCIFL